MRHTRTVVRLMGKSRLCDVMGTCIQEFRADPTISCSEKCGVRARPIQGHWTHKTYGPQGIRLGTRNGLTWLSTCPLRVLNRRKPVYPGYNDARVQSCRPAVRSSIQFDQSFCCALNRQTRTQRFFIQTAKSLIRLSLAHMPCWFCRNSGSHVTIVT